LDEDNIDYVEFIGKTAKKESQSRLSAKPLSFSPKSFAAVDDKCPVAIPVWWGGGGGEYLG